MDAEWKTVNHQFSTSEVIPGSPGMSVYQGPNLLACPRCGTVVARETKEQHIEWHEKVNQILGMGNMLTAFLPEDERLV